MKFRELETKAGKRVLVGKDAKNNEELVKQVGKTEAVLHTAKPGSPFVNIKGRSNNKDRKEAAIFCARYSQDWRDNKNDVEVHSFSGADIYKRKLMKVGTFGVRKFKIIKVKKKEIEILIKRQEKKNGD